jgi:hypothetical protein
LFRQHLDEQYRHYVLDGTLPWLFTSAKFINRSINQTNSVYTAKLYAIKYTNSCGDGGDELPFVLVVEIISTIDFYEHNRMTGIE